MAADPAIDVSEREALCERARDYANSCHPGIGIRNEFTWSAYKDFHVVYLGDGRYIIGHLCQIGFAVRRDGDWNSYPIIYNPTTQRLQVQLPAGCVRPNGQTRPPGDNGYHAGIGFR